MPAKLEELESWVKIMSDLVKKGKVKHIGLSEVPPAWLRKAHTIHPITAIQQEWSLLTRNLEAELVPTCKELGIGIVAYSPLARNLLSDPEKPASDWRGSIPRFSAENFAENKKHIAVVKKIAESKGKTAAQLSLAWLYHQAKAMGVTVVPIPGTTKFPHAKDNLDAVSIDISDEEAAELAKLAELVAGARGDEGYLKNGLEGQLDKLTA